MKNIPLAFRGFLGSVLSAVLISIFFAIGTFLKLPALSALEVLFYWFVSGIAVGMIMVALSQGRSNNVAKFRTLWGGLGYGITALFLAFLAVGTHPPALSDLLPAFSLVFFLLLFTIGLVGMFGVMTVVVVANIWGSRVASQSAVAIMPRELREELAKKSTDLT